MTFITKKFDIIELCKNHLAILKSILFLKSIALHCGFHNFFCYTEVIHFECIKDIA